MSSGSAPPPSPPRRRRSTPQWLGVVAVLLAMGVAGFLVLTGLDNHLFWDDEAATAIYARNLLNQGKLTAWDGTNLMDTTYIDNAVDAHLLAADRLAQNPELSGRIYIISDDDPIPAWEMINAFLKVAGMDPIKPWV